MNPTKLPVNEVFETVQGEATFTGTPSVFIRLQGCPVGCSWCDTKHTWEMTGKVIPIKSMIDKTDDTDCYSLLSITDILEGIPCDSIWLQPLSKSEKATKLCVEQATINNWKISIQTHKFIGVR